MRSTGAMALSVLLLAALSACGGGGGDTTPATVSSMSVASTKYGVPAQVTVTGTHLGNLSLTAPGCKNVTRLTTAPTASTDTTAYFSCTPSGAYTSTISAVTNGNTVQTATLTVAAPIVRMTVVGGNGVNGFIDFALRGNQAPITVDNFLNYVNSGFYDGKDGKGATIFHRVVAGFVVQGGGYPAATSGNLPTPKATTFAPIALETSGGSNLQWTAAMARTSDANSATSQFFFNLANNSSILDKNANSAGYAVFADVSASASVIQAIAASPCTAINQAGLTDGSCVPIPNVVVTSATQTQ